MSAETVVNRILKWQPYFRAIVITMWLLIASVVWLLPRSVPKGAAMAVFWLFRTTAVAGVIYLLCEIRATSEGRLALRALIIDAVLVLPMFAFWLLVWVATY